MRIFYTICVLLLCLTAQQKVSAASTDSLQRLIPSLKGEDKASAYVDLYLLYYGQGEIDSALSTLDELVAFRQGQDSVEREAAARWSRVAVLNNAARFKQLQEEAEVQMLWFREHAMWDRFYQVWQRKCSALYDQGRVQTSLREAQLMQDDAQRRNDNFGRAMAYKQMGIIYYDMQQSEQCIDAFRKSIKFLKAEDEKRGMTSGLYDFLCKAYDRDKDYKAEQEVTKEWFDYLQRMVDLHGATVVNGPYCSAYLAKASAEIGLGQLDEAAYSLKLAERYNLLYPTDLARFYIFFLRARLNMVRGETATALAYTDSLKFIPEHNDDLSTTLRAEILLKMGRAEEAAGLYRTLYESRDSTFGREMRMQLDELNTLFQVDELKIHSQLERSRFLIGIAVLVVLALTLLMFLRVRAARRLAREHQLLQESNEKLEQSYAELKIANERAEESSRMKTNFIQQISHEIRTPLNILSGFTQIITDLGVELDDATKGDVNRRITENTERITNLVNKMLELSDVNSQTVTERPDRVQAVQIAVQAVDASGIDQQTTLQFQLQVASGVGETMLQTNLNLAVRALTSLLDNAQKFTKEGQVLLSLTAPQAGMLVYTVEDTGIGIPPEEAERIFDEFVQLDDYYDGTGIGLAVARSTARRLGGDIVLDTSYVSGARFVFTLPLSPKTDS